MVHLNSDLSFIIPVVTATVAVDSNGGEEDEENEVDNPEEVGVHLEYNQYKEPMVNNKIICWIINYRRRGE